MSGRRKSRTALMLQRALFCYAKSKSELLLMVYNETFRDAIAIGKREGHDLSNPAESVFALAVPVIRCCQPQGSPTQLGDVSRVGSFSEQVWGV